MNTRRASGAEVARRTVEVAGVLGLRAVAVPPRLLRGEPLARQLRAGFAQLGPVFVKLGQVVASTPAFFPAAVQAEFRLLLDDLPPFDVGEAERRARRALGDRLGSFDPEPVSAASVAQVHRARVDGRHAAVKVLRPGIREQFDLDLAVLRRLLPTFERLVPYGSLARPTDVLAEFTRTVAGELDLQAEGAELAGARAFLAEVGADDVVVPEPLGGDDEVLAMGWVDGFAIDDRAELAASGHDPGRLLQTLLLRLQEMVLVRRRFHGDLHAANVLVTPDGRLAWIDWGIVGELGQEQALACGRLFAGALHQEYPLIVDGLSGLGVAIASPGAVAADLDRALTPLLDPRLPSVDLSRLVRRTIRVMLRHRVPLPRALVLLAKQIVYFDRYARTLVPERRLMEDATEIYAYFCATYPDLVRRLVPAGTLEAMS